MIVAALLASALTVSRPDVVISAGHEGRPQNCVRFPAHHCNLGAAGERAWTPIVADEAAALLRAHGVRVARLPADFDGAYDAGAAAFVHFDGSQKACSSGASVGYHDAPGAAASRAWHQLYGRYFRFGFQPDNFTDGLRNYYAFRQVRARYGALVLELGEITCPAQRTWLAPRLRWEGALLAHFLSARIGKGGVPDPGPFFGK